MADDLAMACLESMRAKFCGLEGNGLVLDDNAFIRYLKARDYNFEKASSMLDDTLKWRQEFGVNDYKSWMDVLSKETATGKMYCRGHDKQGHSIVYMKPGLENTNDYDGNLKNLVYTLEKSVNSGLARNPPQWKVLLIIDYDRYSMLNAPPLKTSLAVLSILQNHYPETLFRAYMVRPPWIFQTVYNVIYPFIDPVTKEKIQMISGSADDVKRTLLRDVEEPVLEAAFGGADTRPFDSEKYLRGPFHMDYFAMLNQEAQIVVGEEESKSANPPVV